MKNLNLIILILFIQFTLIGCSTGKYVGELKDGKRHGQGTLTKSDGRKYEGVNGLRGSFIQAGAKSVLSTLWEISDEGTK